MPRSSKRWAAFSRSAFCASVDRVMRHKRITFYDACQLGSCPASNPRFCARTGSYLLRSGRHRAALRRPFIHRTDQTVLHYPGVEKRPDELEYALVGNPFRDARHQNVVIDSVEKFFEIQVDHDVEALGDIPLRLGHGLMGGTSWAEAVAVLGERRVPTLLQNLQHGLLDQSVDDTGDAEFPDPAVRFGYLDPFDRLWLVGPRQQLGSYVWPMLTQEALGVVDGHPINARSSLVVSNALPCAYEVLSFAHLLHQLHRCSRAFGFCYRHDRFDPEVTADRGFTPLFRRSGQRSLDFLPQSVHELPVLLAAPNRSGLRPSFPARPIRCSAFRLGVPH